MGCPAGAGVPGAGRPRRLGEASPVRVDGRALGVYLLGVFLGALDTGVIGPAFPVIARAFHVSLRWNAWTVTVYTVAYVASTVMAGALGDRIGRRRVFRAGLVAFGVASLLATFSAGAGFWAFLAARAIQGAGAGAVYPNAQAEGVALFPRERRGLALGVFGGVFGLAAVVGPNVGGALAQFVGWPAIFAINVPLAGLAVAAAREPRGPARAAVAATDGIPDPAGGVGFSAGLTGLLLALAVPGPWRWLCLAGGAAAVALFAWRQRTARLPFLDTGPLASRGGIALIAGAAVIGLDMSAAVFVPSMAQARLHLGVFASGVALMPAALSGAVLAGAGGVLVDRIGPRGPLQVGLAAAVLGGVLLGRGTLHMAGFVAAMLCLGLATAFTMGAPINRMALSLYRDERPGLALSLIAVFRSVGLAAGPVILTAAAARAGFPGMFRAVAIASALGVLVFTLVPNVRPERRAALGRPTA